MKKVPLLLIGMLVAGIAQLISNNTLAATLSPVQSYLRVTEIMYNPSPAPAINTNDQNFEYLKLKNISTNVSLDLSGVRFTNGITFDFTGAAVTTLAPGQTVFIVPSKSAFAARYGADKLVAGKYSDALKNSGEKLTLVDVSGGIVLDFSYSDAWYPITDGSGFSLVIVNEQVPTDTWGLKSSWWPGVAEPRAATIAPIVVNEILAHTDPPDVDSIELYNPTATNVNIGGWFLTDDLLTPNKYRIPDNIIISAGGCKVFYADSSFGVGATPFLLSEYGEGCFLLSGDASSNLTGYFHGFEFPASPNGVSLGRYVNSQGREEMVLQSAKTLGFQNAGPRIGPVVISKIMYHPPDLSGGVDNVVDEFIELRNITAANVPLWCLYVNEQGYGMAAATNTWRLEDAVNYSFPQNLSLAPNGRLMVVGFDPITNPAQLDAFRARYSLPNDIPILGPWQGKLSNNGETITLSYPDKPDVFPTNIVMPYVVMDKVAYKDSWAWPIAADGNGAALVRLDPHSYGNDLTNWTAQLLSAFRLEPGYDANAHFGLGFQAIAGLSYSIQTNATLDKSGWGTWMQIFPGSTNQWFNITDSQNAAARFYRVITPTAP